MRHAPRRGLARLAWVLASLALVGCSGAEGQESEAATVPEAGQCRLLTPADVALPSNDTEPVDCTEKHTAETYAVGTLPGAVASAGYDDRDAASAAHRICSTKFERFLGADESLVLRTVLTWAWFRPSEQAWADGARWYRCDVVGGGGEVTSFRALPTTTRGLLTGRPDDRWLVCARGETVAGSPKLPCTEPHTWRAVTVIKLGEPDDDYPGDRLAEIRTRDFCSDSVGAWLSYPVSYDFGYTWFHEAEWEAGNRLSVCWAKTDE